MNTTVRNFSLRTEAERRQSQALEAWQKACRTYQADPTDANRAHMIAASKIHDQAKRNAEAARLTHKHTRGTVLA